MIYLRALLSYSTAQQFELEHSFHLFSLPPYSILLLNRSMIFSALKCSMSRGRSGSRAGLVVLCAISLHPSCLVNFYPLPHALTTSSHFQNTHGLKYQPGQICHHQKPSHYAQYLYRRSDASVTYMKLI